VKFGSLYDDAAPVAVAAGRAAAYMSEVRQAFDAPQLAGVVFPVAAGQWDPDHTGRHGSQKGKSVGRTESSRYSLGSPGDCRAALCTH
jgi:hypothetical protein